MAGAVITRRGVLASSAGLVAIGAPVASRAADPVRVSIADLISELRRDDDRIKAVWLRQLEIADRLERLLE